jgi:hypothetical protein
VFSLRGVFFLTIGVPPLQNKHLPKELSTPIQNKHPLERKQTPPKKTSTPPRENKHSPERKQTPPQSAAVSDQHCRSLGGVAIQPYSAAAVWG